MNPYYSPSVHHKGNGDFTKRNMSWVVAAHTFNRSNQEAEVDSLIYKASYT